MNGILGRKKNNGHKVRWINTHSGAEALHAVREAMGAIKRQLSNLDNREQFFDEDLESALDALKKVFGR